MNVFFLTETQSGCYKWRGAIPAKYLRRRGHTVEILADHPRPYQAPDVMVFFRAHYVEAFKMVEWCKNNSIRVVFDTDDALDLVPPDSVHYAELQPRLPVYKFLLEEADVVTTTTETLAEYLREWNPNVRVLPNSVDPEEWTCQPKQTDVRVGWTGFATHFGDLAAALDAVRDVQKKNPFTFVLQGLCKEPNLEGFREGLIAHWGKAVLRTPFGKSFQRFMDKLSGIKYEFHPAVAAADHARKVCELALDIGIAPLAETRFNRHKSCIKFYEYALSGAVTVASQVLPYSVEVPVTAKNKREAWKEKLEYVLSADREKLWREQRDWVLTYRNMQKNVDLWEQVLAGDSVRADPVLQTQ